jgi:hypothetical protein
VKAGAKAYAVDALDAAGNVIGSSAYAPVGK